MDNLTSIDEQATALLESYTVGGARSVRRQLQELAPLRAAAVAARMVHLADANLAARITAFLASVCDPREQVNG